MIKLTKLTIGFLLLLSCKSESTNDSKLEPQTDSLEYDKIEVETTPSAEIVGKIYGYGDSIRIHLKPNDSSTVLSYLDFADSINRIKLFADENGKMSDNLFFPMWCAVILNDDTAWIRKQPDISAKYEIDTAKNIVILNYYSHCDYGGFGCYYRTKVINLLNNKIILDSYFDTKSTFQLNDSRYLLTPYGDVNIYDLDRDTIIYHTHGKSVAKSNIEDKIYFIKEWEDGKRSIPVELIAYNFNLDSANILYTEPNDSTFNCISVDDGESCSELTIENNDTIEYIYLELYKYREKPIDEGDVYKYDIKINNKGKFYYRKQN